MKTLRRITILSLVAALPLALLGPDATAQKKGKKIKVKKGYKLETFAEHLKIIRPDNKAWKAVPQSGMLGAKLEHGVMTLQITGFIKDPGPTMKMNIKINGRTVDSRNPSKLAKELMRQYEEGFKKVYMKKKPKKVKVHNGKCVAFDMIVSGGKSKECSKMLNDWTAAAAGVDATRSFNPREIKMHIRQVVAMGKSGTFIFHLGATEGFFKKHRKEVNRLLKSIHVE